MRRTAEDILSFYSREADCNSIDDGQVACQRDVRFPCSVITIDLDLNCHYLQTKAPSYACVSCFVIGRSAAVLIRARHGHHFTLLLAEEKNAVTFIVHENVRKTSIATTTST
jgi:hypothetical protein